MLGAIHDFFKLVVYEFDLSEQLNHARLLLQLHCLQASDFELLRQSLGSINFYLRISDCHYVSDQILVHGLSESQEGAMLPFLEAI